VVVSDADEVIMFAQERLLFSTEFSLPLFLTVRGHDRNLGVAKVMLANMHRHIYTIYQPPRSRRACVKASCCMAAQINESLKQ